jgi:hypothetical protein
MACSGATLPSACYSLATADLKEITGCSILCLLRDTLTVWIQIPPTRIEFSHVRGRMEMDAVKLWSIDRRRLVRAPTWRRNQQQLTFDGFPQLLQVNSVVV